MTQILAGDGLRGVDYVLYGAGGYHVAAVLTRPWTEVNDVVRLPHDGLVVLDDDHGVAQVSQPLQRSDKTVIVGGMQSYRRLVADVEDSHEAGAYLRRQPDTLRLTAA